MTLCKTDLKPSSVLHNYERLTHKKAQKRKYVVVIYIVRCREISNWKTVEISKVNSVKTRNGNASAHPRCLVRTRVARLLYISIYLSLRHGSLFLPASAQLVVVNSSWALIDFALEGSGTCTSFFISVCECVFVTLPVFISFSRHFYRQVQQERVRENKLICCPHLESDDGLNGCLARFFLTLLGLGSCGFGWWQQYPGCVSSLSRCCLSLSHQWFSRWTPLGFDDECKQQWYAYAAVCSMLSEAHESRDTGPPLNFVVLPPTCPLVFHFETFFCTLTL